jgi:hypothetical protein
VTHPRDPWAYIARGARTPDRWIRHARRARRRHGATRRRVRPFFHVPEVRDMLGLSPQPRATWDRELARVPGPIVHRVGADLSPRRLGARASGPHIDVKTTDEAALAAPPRARGRSSARPRGARLVVRARATGAARERSRPYEALSHRRRAQTLGRGVAVRGDAARARTRRTSALRARLARVAHRGAVVCGHRARGVGEAARVGTPGGT